ncbi:MAG: hypothetical protein WBY94_13230 [Polyangiaceae bacterium]
MSNGLLLRKSGSEAGIIVERGADLVVIRMLPVVDDPLPLVVVPMKALAGPPLDELGNAA